MLVQLAIRIDFIDEQTTTKLLESLSNSSSKFIVWQEISKISKKKHYHIYMEAETNIKLDSYMKKIRRQFKNENYQSSQFCVQKCKNIKKYMVYIAKDGVHLPIYTIEYTDDQINSFKKQSMAITNDKKLPIYKKLYNRWMELDESDQPKPDLYSFIADTLVLEFDKFCRKSQIIDYAVYIQIRQNQGKNTRTILNDEYGLMDWNDYNSKKREQNYKQLVENQEYGDSEDDHEIEI